MTPLALVLVALVAVVAIGLLLRTPIQRYLQMRGDRVVTCPDNEQHVAVRVDAGHAVMSSGKLRLESCTRWPEKAGCGQDCLREIEAQPMDCLVKMQVSRWYAGKACVLCGTALDAVDWLEHRPALRQPDGRTVEWATVPPQTLYDVLATHEPVCWDCHIAETFRRTRPNLVLDNPHASDVRH